MYTCFNIPAERDIAGLDYPILSAGFRKCVILKFQAGRYECTSGRHLNSHTIGMRGHPMAMETAVVDRCAAWSRAVRPAPFISVLVTQYLTRHGVRTAAEAVGGGEATRGGPYTTRHSVVRRRIHAQASARHGLMIWRLQQRIDREDKKLHAACVEARGPPMSGRCIATGLVVCGIECR